MSLDPFERHTFFNVLFGTFILWGAPYTCSQYLIHRALCLSSIGRGRLALYINFVGQVVMVTLVALIGLILYAFYLDCDPVKAGVVQKRDAVIPLFVLQQFSVKAPGVPGVFISCLFSGALSTLDSALHALASVTWEEVKGLERFRGISERTETIIVRCLSVFFGICATGMAFLCDNLGSLISTGGKLFGACMGPMFGYTLVSILVPFVNLKGSCFGLIAGQVINIWLSMGSVVYGAGAPPLHLSANNCSIFNVTSVEDANNTQVPIHLVERPFEFEDIYRMSYNLYPIIGMVLTMVLCVVASLMTGGYNEIKDCDEEYIHPLAWKLFRMKSKKTSINLLYVMKDTTESPLNVERA